MDRFRILSLDGGGIRGLVTVILLQRLDQKVPGWLDKVDLLAGTSTGGLLALGIAHGLSLDTMRRLYIDKGGEIFDDSWLDDLRDFGKCIGADYDNEGLERVLGDLFGNITLGQLNKKVLVTAFDLDNESPNPEQRTWKPKLFHNCKKNDSDWTQLAKKVGMYTSAAPTYFPSVDGYIDGGVYAPNPAMCALAQALDQRNEHSVNDLNKIRLLSLGTGTSLAHIEAAHGELDWGYAQWAKPILSVMFDGCSDVATYQCRQMLRDHFERLAPVFPPGTIIDMDAVDKLGTLRRFAETVADAEVDRVANWLRNNW